MLAEARRISHLINGCLHAGEAIIMPDTSIGNQRRSASLTHERRAVAINEWTAVATYKRRH